MTPNGLLRAGYRYADFGSFTQATPFAFSPGSSVSHFETENAVRAGVSYKFDPFLLPQ